MNVIDVANKIVDRVQGTPDDIMQVVDMMIEDGDLDAEFFRVNETGILYEVDNQVFMCVQCNWVCPTSDAMEGPTGEDICDQCYSENN